MFEPLRTGSFRWLFGSNIAFFFAMGSQQVVRAWLAYDLTKSELALGMTMFAAAVPMFIISPFGGVAADRLERRSLIMAGQALGLLAQAAILILILTDQIEFWHLLVSASVMGCVFPLIMPARQAIVVNIVGREGLASAMGLGMAGMNATRIVGPAVGGFLITYLGVGGAYGFGVALFGLGLLFMLGVERSPAPQAALDKTVFGGIWEGVQYVGSHRLILTMLGFGLLPMFLAMPFQNLLVVFTEEVWEVGPSGFGVLSAAGGVGGIVGAFWVAGRRSEKRLRLMIISMFVFGVLLFGFSQASYFWLAVVLIFTADIFASVFSTLNNTAIQLLIPDEVRGRISAFLMMSFSLPLLGTVPVAALAEAYGAPLAVGSASLLAVVVTFLFYVSSKALRSLDEDLEKARQESAG
jgi:MFS family permease